MSELNRVASGKDFTANRNADGTVTINGSGETLDTCEQLRLVQAIPVDPHSPPTGQFTLDAYKESGQICGFIVMFKPVVYYCR